LTDRPKQKNLFDPELDDTEGVFDAQMALPMPSIAPPPPFRTIRKRDGREEVFDKRKIAGAIAKAAETVGSMEEDLALSLAAAVSIYLSKRLQDQSPTVDQVHDAVERVLIHMGEAETALAYARYRDRRDRIRRLRRGDMGQLVGELAEARHARDAAGGHPDSLLSVRTSADGLSQWDSGRIVAALEREARLDRSAAEVIAAEVEQQIRDAKITTLTTSLVREMVDAKLIEHGLLECRDRHRRLGVPLYDAERIIRGLSPETLAQGPVATDRILARAVKKEYALSQVFSGEVSEAHLRGEFHIHHLEAVDRLFSTEASLEGIARLGMGLPNSREFAAAPRHAGTLLAQWIKSHDLFQGYFAEGVVWSDANVFLAPFVKDLDKAALNQFAQMLVYEFSSHHLVHGVTGQPPEIVLSWRIPSHLKEAAAVGPGGAVGAENYGACEYTAQNLAWAVLEVLKAGGVNGVCLPAPLVTIAIEPDFWQADGQESFLRLASEVAALGRSIRFSLRRHPGDPGAPPWRSSETAFQQITLNLPRAAYESGTVGKLEKLLEERLCLAISAHEQKRNFLEGLLDEAGNRPLSLLATPRGGHAFLSLDAAHARIAVDGLGECVRALLGGSSMDNDEEALRIGEGILTSLKESCRTAHQRTGLWITLAQNNESWVSQRFADLDAGSFPKTVGAALGEDGELRYSKGVRLSSTHTLSPIEAVRREGALHAHLAGGAQTEVRLPEAPLSAAAIMDFLQKAYLQTANGLLHFRS
jgi:ribonucleoside-triphosphate reductase (formate)